MRVNADGIESRHEGYQELARAIIEEAVAEVRDTESTPIQREMALMWLEGDLARFLADAVGVEPGAWAASLRLLSSEAVANNGAWYSNRHNDEGGGENVLDSH
jgi:hypothetical protein